MGTLAFFRRPKPAPNVICCHSGKLAVETESAIKAHAPDTTFIDTSGDQFLYRDTLQGRWTADRDLVVIEQDIEISANVLPSFCRCKKEWCVFAYQGPPEYGYLYRSLGCTRFSADLQRRIPFHRFDVRNMTWNLMDAFIAATFRIYGMNPHIHGIVKHHHDYLRDNNFYYHKLCLQIEPDGTKSLYANNPDGTRGAFIRKVRHGTWIVEERKAIGKGERHD